MEAKGWYPLAIFFSPSTQWAEWKKKKNKDLGRSRCTNNPMLVKWSPPLSYCISDRGTATPRQNTPGSALSHWADLFQSRPLNRSWTGCHTHGLNIGQFPLNCPVPPDIQAMCMAWIHSPFLSQHYRVPPTRSTETKEIPSTYKHVTHSTSPHVTVLRPSLSNQGKDRVPSLVSAVTTIWSKQDFFLTLQQNIGGIKGAVQKGSIETNLLRFLVWTKHRSTLRRHRPGMNTCSRSVTHYKNVTPEPTLTAAILCQFPLTRFPLCSGEGTHKM